MAMVSVRKETPHGNARQILSTQLRRWRLRQGLPLKQVATEIGVALSTFSAWESGARFPSAENLDVLAGYMKVNVCELLRPEETLPVRVSVSGHPVGLG